MSESRSRATAIPNLHANLNLKTKSRNESFLGVKRRPSLLGEQNSMDSVSQDLGSGLSPHNFVLISLLFSSGEWLATGNLGSRECFKGKTWKEVSGSR